MVAGPPLPESNLKRPVMVAIAGIAVALAGWILWQQARGPVLPGYQVQAAPLVQTVVATGRVVAVSRAQVGSPLTGVVVERRVREGDAVAPGDVLAVLRADDLNAVVREAEAALAQLQQARRPQAQAVQREADARLAQASREVARRRDLFQRQLIARETLEQAVQAETVARSAVEQARIAAMASGPGSAEEAAIRARLANARAQLAKTTLRAEVAGVVLTRNAEPGDLVQPGRVLFEIARAGATEVLVAVDEKNLGVLAVGQGAECVADAYPQRAFPAVVNFIAPRVDPQRGSVDVRLAVDPVPGFLRQDMTVSVNIRTGRRERAIVVPNDALAINETGEAVVWGVENGRVQPRPVTLGLRGLTRSEVTAGLRAGDWILADSGAAVAEGDRVRVSAVDAPTDAGASATRKELPAKLD